MELWKISLMKCGGNKYGAGDLHTGARFTIQLTRSWPQSRLARLAGQPTASTRLQRPTRTAAAAAAAVEPKASTNPGSPRPRRARLGQAPGHAVECRPHGLARTCPSPCGPAQRGRAAAALAGTGRPYVKVHIGPPLPPVRKRKHRQLGGKLWS